jgi:hypothetical protein
MFKFFWEQLESRLVDFTNNFSRQSLSLFSAVASSRSFNAGRDFYDMMFNFDELTLIVIPRLQGQTPRRILDFLVQAVRYSEAPHQLQLPVIRSIPENLFVLSVQIQIEI